jgi:hypothetical protein
VVAVNGDTAIVELLPGKTTLRLVRLVRLAITLRMK